MKISKPILQAMALAVAVTTVGSSCKDGLVKPKKEEAKKEQQRKLPDNCPACGMG
ncbi:hypothetical protein GGR92_004485 [Spirosoma lacussanchae]|uniref:chryseobasin-related MNIO class RiPP peptide n=1 Tax=Spirosoma lacussanchae TaxID=1884249 RepID=UPI001486F4F9|nr:hypothetical protein [Spirosoma lacussanchae]